MSAANGAASASWQGKLHLNYGVTGDQTRLRAPFAQAPLKIQRPFYPEAGGVCHSILLHTAGGMVGGDRLSIDVNLAPESKALLTSAAAAKIYGSIGTEASQNIQIHLGANARLEWLPQETIVFNQAQFRQTLRVTLDPGAQWLGWDIVRLGRSARGEEFQSGNWRSHTEIWQGNRPLWIDRQRLSGSTETVASPHGLAHSALVGSLAWVGMAVTPDFVEAIRTQWHPDPGSSAEIGVTRLQQGLLCRYRGCSTLEVQRWFRAVWQQIRTECWGRDICLPRVWQR
ncbi:urease accessory protein UreD [Synechococcales cyanobacterium C]|uniref:Urease accessory protein UreD n=1 Tax=Petrachloros mirabilis ULC683 TaxID=2781853 RepID=A0A8K2AGX6_9CYAN|nr:urease accessory protein UreD [Petrachloros mirabilis]NCJ05549.1 urease accessory protein UreD [Petrachloros mirabilis ULC683]